MTLQGLEELIVAPTLIGSRKENFSKWTRERDFAIFVMDVWNMPVIASKFYFATLSILPQGKKS